MKTIDQGKALRLLMKVRSTDSEGALAELLAMFEEPHAHTNIDRPTEPGLWKIDGRWVFVTNIRHGTAHWAVLGQEGGELHFADLRETRATGNWTGPFIVLDAIEPDPWDFKPQVGDWFRIFSKGTQLIYPHIYQCELVQDNGIRIFGGGLYTYIYTYYRFCHVPEVSDPPPPPGGEK